jgi:hypothetical protein
VIFLCFYAACLGLLPDGVVARGAAQRALG